MDLAEIMYLLPDMTGRRECDQSPPPSLSLSSAAHRRLPLTEWETVGKCCGPQDVRKKVKEKTMNRQGFIQTSNGTSLSCDCPSLDVKDDYVVHRYEEPL